MAGSKVITENLQISGGNWRDENYNPALLFGFGTNPDLVTIPGTDDIIIASFSATTEEEVNGGFEINHDAILGAAIKFHVHWCPTNTNTGVARWGLSYAIAQEDTGAITSSTTIYVNDTASGTAYRRQTVTFADISVPASEVGLQFGFRFFRDATDAADTYNADAGIMWTIGAHIQIDQMGSTQITTK